MTIYLPIQIGRLEATPTLNGNRQKKGLMKKKFTKEIRRMADETASIGSVGVEEAKRDDDDKKEMAKGSAK
jgi:hypothetical protein